MKTVGSHLATLLVEGSDLRRQFAPFGKYIALLVVVVLLFGWLFHVIMAWEGQEHTWFTGIYWALTVMSTLGFGDIIFESDLGRVFSSVVLLTGMVLLLIILPFLFIRLVYAHTREAIMELRECVRLSEGNSVCQALLGHALARGGQVTEARQVLQQLQAVAQSRYIPPLNHAFVHLGLGEVDEAFAFLEQAYDERSSWLVSLNVEPLFDPIREDPRFTGLVARVGLAD